MGKVANRIFEGNPEFLERSCFSSKHKQKLACFIKSDEKVN